MQIASCPFAYMYFSCGLRNYLKPLSMISLAVPYLKYGILIVYENYIFTSDGIRSNDR